MGNLMFTLLACKVAIISAATISNDNNILSLTKGSPTIIKLTMNDNLSLFKFF